MGITVKLRLNLAPLKVKAETMGEQKLRGKWGDLQLDEVERRAERRQRQHWRSWCLVTAWYL